MHTSNSKPPVCGETNRFNAADLLQRDPIELDPANIQKVIVNSIVLITGAAGSIGSELAWQICSYHPFKIILIDQAETPLNDLDIRLSQQFRNVIIQSYPANITDAVRMEMIFSNAKPQIVFHTAAYKHVPFMENHPYEAISTNVFGTKILADLAIAHAVSRFIFISTDKAVKPSSIMGATKHIAELYIQYLARNECFKTQYVITRFGNVLGSNGSFMPTFEKQIRAGGPITITHPDVRRYMMTIPEACQLVLEAGATGKNGAILFFDMGRPIKILDIAKRMIALTGHNVDDINIEYIGLRPGEKLCEELYDDCQISENVTQSKILVSTNQESALCPENMLQMLRKALESGNDEEMKNAIWRALPEFSD
ncbi:polysaccharide biosynthesis protein [Dyadobacter sp. CY347]|uniref:polysaccharide biosynthesis protein n=1 Tax=Dyadobacter sp. CY347 TaxID=2909336 RepID=UPI001F1AB7C9|nr:polysaccharide biosynthesis protein [Dyadobacter sp. CY347]MCF2489562.1 polysaccharide biosynthesis protein [Dyadobacter sp. CY347]